MLGPDISEGKFLPKVPILKDPQELTGELALQ